MATVSLQKFVSLHMNVYKKQKIFSEKQKGFRDGLSYSTPQKSKETRGKPLPSLGPIPLKKCRI